MAGPWLKVEYATIRKIEVARIAAILECSRREAFGMCFEFWCWCDATLRDGHIAGITLSQLDDMSGLPAGFCQAMATAGWLVVEADRIIVVNFMKHLGKSAKNRAESAKRQAANRSKKQSR